MKSNVSDHMKLARLVYIDACAKCTADVSDFRDIETLISRTEKEGLSFLTITLPQFCNDFERSLALGYIDSTCFRAFRKHGAIPAFLQGMLSRVFSRETGRINDVQEDTPTIVESVRQVCLLFKKVEVACTPERVLQAFSSYAEIEQSLKAFSPEPEDVTIFRDVSFMLWSDALRGLVPADCRPKHGPGATAEGASGNQKYRWQFWHDRLEPYFPIIDNGYPLGLPYYSEELDKLTILPEEQELPVRVITVPKTLKSPRIIAIEPCCMQFVQQGLRDVLYERLESSRFSTGHVNFTDQSVNQKLAMSASANGQWATIDLSDASDRVPLSLVQYMFESNPLIWEAILACRSTHAQVPGIGLLGPLLKFASMGSALCFPIEAMYFYTVCVVARLRSANLPVTSGNVFNVSRGVYVYGDDIIVPTGDAVIVLDTLQKYNCKVNSNKTFFSGSFRESCGVDAFAGYMVNPVYLKQLRPENKQQAKSLISWCATANLFYEKGYWRTAQYMFDVLEGVLGLLPVVPRDSSGLGRKSFLGHSSISRWNERYHAFEVRAWAPIPVNRTDYLDGYGALMKSFLKLEDLKNLPVSRDALHLERSAQHGAVALKRRWLPVT